MEHVYKIVDTNGVVEYVGVTRVPAQRKRQHFRNKPSEIKSGHGTFYGRTDLTFVIVASFLTREAALTYEGMLKRAEGLEWTEHTMKSKGGQISSSIVSTCPHCGITSRGNAMKRWHFDSCKQKKATI